MSDTILLSDDGDCRNRHYRVRKGSTLQLKLSPSLEFRRIAIKTNMPMNQAAFQRNEFYSVPCNEGYFIPIRLAGSFDFTVQDEKTGESLMEGCFVVDPELRVSRDIVLKPEEISCQTYIVKSLGPLSEWKSRLSVARECGYNMVHLTPVQRLGVSNSSYSITDHFSPNPTLECDDLSELSELVRELREDWHMLTISDVVLNHTSICSAWIAHHPESGYNLEVCPHLRPAYLLDRALWHFNREVSEGLWESRGLGPGIGTELHLTALHNILKHEVVPPLKIHEMFCCDVAAHRQSAGDLRLVQDPQFRRNKSGVEGSPQSVGELEELNRRKIGEIEEHLEMAISNIVSNARYNFVDPRGPRWGRVTAETPLTRCYFAKVVPHMSLAEEEREMYGPNSKYIFALNGWVMGWDALRDFALSDVYLRRELIVWGDSIKLRYGSCPADCPYLWGRMERYVSSVAQAFDGVRLDNCHSTPLHVAQHMVDVMRRINPNLYVLAELFTGSEESDSIFSNTLGITTLVREAFAAWDAHELGRMVYKFGGKPIGSFSTPFERVLSPRLPQAMLVDMTHDNPCPLKERSLLYPPAATAMISIAACAIGSTRGYDEYVPHQIDVVTETRLYSTDTVQFHAFRREMNRLHLFLAEEGYDEIFVDQMTPNIVAITRRSSQTLDSVITISHNSFGHHPTHDIPCRPLSVAGNLTEIVIESSLSSLCEDYVRDEHLINGIRGVTMKLRTRLPPRMSEMISVSTDNGENVITLTNNFTPGSVVVFRVELPPRLAQIQNQVFNNLFSHSLRREIAKLTLLDLNRILYRHHSEENPGEEYEIPEYGLTVYNGLQGQISLIDKIMRLNDQNHPLCKNLRNGNWIMTHSVQRLFNLKFKYVGQWLSTLVDFIGQLPRSSVPPRYFYVLSGLGHLLHKQCDSLLMSTKECSLMKMLKLGSVILFGEVDSAGLPPLAVPLSNSATLAAGLPHFSHGVFRNWGRDTFISLRGLLLLTGRIEEARATILGYAGALRHGLIPNLLGEGICPRYNARDAVWFWLQAIKDYVAQVGHVQILSDPVLRLSSRAVQPLRDIVQEALDEHFRGISFREEGAGPRIDENMSCEGFDVTAGVMRSSGFVFGGNRWNCGTWMDKMGSCEFSGNKGIPASPRDGSAVELVGLCYSVVSWLGELHRRGDYGHGGVGEGALSWTDWAQRIKDNFEAQFYIPEGDTSRHAFRRGIYKDSVGSWEEWRDYQLRPNFCLAMIYAPELFDAARAWEALRVAEDVLVGPLGIKTLDPRDWNYNGFYRSDVVGDPKCSRGFNYHQGPEWIWICGVFLRAKLITARRMGRPTEETRINQYILNHYNNLVESDWRGLDELTNENGSLCEGSCRVQAWSMAAFIELVDLLN